MDIKTIFFSAERLEGVNKIQLGIKMYPTEPENVKMMGQLHGSCIPSSRMGVPSPGLINNIYQAPHTSLALKLNP